MEVGRVSAFDLVIVLYLAFHAIGGWRRGLAASLLGLVSVVLSTVAALTLCRPAAIILNRFTGAISLVSGHIQRILVPAVQRLGSFEGVLEAMSLDTSLGESLSGGARAAADALAWLVVTTACFIGLLIVLRLVLGALARVICLPFESGPAAAVNSLAGSAFGCVVGLIHVAVVWFAATLLATFGAIQPEWLHSSIMFRLVGGLAARAVPYLLGKGT